MPVYTNSMTASSFLLSCNDVRSVQMGALRTGFLCSWSASTVIHAGLKTRVVWPVFGLERRLKHRCVGNEVYYKAIRFPWRFENLKLGKKCERAKHKQNRLNNQYRFLSSRQIQQGARQKKSPLDGVTAAPNSATRGKRSL